jgi:hypothetical protein
MSLLMARKRTGSAANAKGRGRGAEGNRASGHGDSSHFVGLKELIGKNLKRV